MTDSVSPRLSGRLFAVLLGLVAAAALGLRLWHIDLPQLWEDDYLTLDRSLMAPADLTTVQLYQGPADTIFDFQPPLSYLLVHYALEISPTVLAARVPALLAGTLSLLVIGLLGARAGGRGAGLLAAALAGLSLFHLDFSRAIKPYALFLCTMVLSQYALIRWLDRRGDRDGGPDWPGLAGYALATAALLATAYQGAPILLGEGLAVAGLFVWRRGVFAGPGRWKRLAGLALAMGLAVLAWLPLAPGVFFAREFLRNPGIDPWHGLDFAFFADVLRGLFFQHAPHAAGATALLAGLLALGLATGRRIVVLVLAASGLAAALAILSSHSDLRPIVSWRHLSCLFPLVVVCAGVGAARLAVLAARPFRSLRAGATAATAVGVGLCALAMGPALAALEPAARHTLSRDRDLMRVLSRLPRPVPDLVFTGYHRNVLGFSSRWHLPGRFAGPGDFDRPGYRRTLIVDRFTAPSQRHRAAPRGTLLASWRTGAYTTRLAIAGLPSLAPLLLAPDAAGRLAYADDFRDWRYYREASRSRNFTVDTATGLLRPARYERPATAVWHFVLPPRAPATPAPTLTAAIDAALYKRHPTLPADAFLTVEASPDGLRYTPLARLGHADFLLPDGAPRQEPRRFFEEMGFYHQTRQATATVDLTPALGENGVWLRLTYHPGRREGFLNVDAVRLTGRCPAPVEPDRPEARPLAAAAANLARNCASTRYDPQTRPIGETAYVFAAPQHPELAGTLPGGAVIGTPAALDAFRAAHAGLRPALVLPDAAGRPAVVVHDPALAASPEAAADAGLGANRPTAKLRARTAFPVASLWLWGDLHAPTLTFGQTSVPVPVSAPPGTMLRLTPGGAGLLRFSPDFTAPGVGNGSNVHGRNLAVSTSYPDYAGGLTCRPETDCGLDYVFVSALPMTELRFQLYPRLYGGPGPTGSCRLAYSTNGRDFKTAMDFQGAPTGDWTPMFTRRFVRVRLDAPATFVTVRLTLRANAEAEFWSPERPVDRMVIEADLDARSLPPLTLPAGDTAVTLSGDARNAVWLRLGRRQSGLERVWPGR